MPITSDDIFAPTVKRETDWATDYYCTLCDERVSFNHNFEPEPHTLTECLTPLKEKIGSLARKDQS